MKYTLGIDTSNYTTSVAVCCDGDVVSNIKIPLTVSGGAVGLRQSDAVFLHTKNLPEAFSQLHTDLKNISAIGASSRPRDIDGSYMPCFLPGFNMAQILSQALSVPLYAFSHQQGHIKAAVYSSGFDEKCDKFYALHLSGGTLEILSAENKSGEYKSDIVAKALDLTAGQLIDRVGCMLGFSFPCGKQVSEYAGANTKKIPKIRPSLKGADCNLSGVYNIAKKYFDSGEDKEFICAFVLEYIIKTVDGMITELWNNKGKAPLLFCGGVSASTVVKKFFAEKYGAYFASPEFSADNAAGVALLACDKL